MRTYSVYSGSSFRSLHHSVINFMFTSSFPGLIVLNVGIFLIQFKLRIFLLGSLVSQFLIGGLICWFGMVSLRYVIIIMVQFVIYFDRIIAFVTMILWDPGYGKLCISLDWGLFARRMLDFWVWSFNCMWMDSRWLMNVLLFLMLIVSESVGFPEFDVFVYYFDFNNAFHWSWVAIQLVHCY